MARKSRNTVPEWDQEAEAAVDADEAGLRQMAARRRLERYLESRRLDEHLRDVFYDEEY